MYQRICDGQRMTDNEASVNYPDNYILVRRDSMNSVMGTVLYVGDNMGELISLAMSQYDSVYGIVEGLNYQRSLGGVVVGG